MKRLRLRSPIAIGERAESLASRVARARGLALSGVLCAVALVTIVASVTYPGFVRMRRNAATSQCVSNLRRIGQAFALYREENAGADQGTVAQMALPPTLGPLRGISKFRCRGNALGANGYFMNYPDPRVVDPGQQAATAWVKYVAFAGPTAILLFDPNHQPSYPRSRTWECWTAIGMRLDGSVRVRTRMGFPTFRSWWHN